MPRSPHDGAPHLSIPCPSSPVPILERELMDDAALPYAEMERALDDIERVHRWVGHGALWRALAPLLEDAPSRIMLLDIGTGSGAVAATVAQRARPMGTEILAVGLDRKLCHLVVGRRRWPSQLRVVGDARRLPFDDGAMEIAISTLFQHHFDDRDGSAVLAEMRRVSSIAGVVSDLRGSRLGTLLGGLVLRLLRLGPIASYDGKLSLRQAWSLHRVRSAAGLNAIVDLRRRWPFRWSLVLRPGAGTAVY